jgi:predicted enzyme related to lactoylglutathione lyase
MGAPVLHFEIVGGKGDQLKTFYGGLFGWNIDSNNPMNYGMVDTAAGGTGINGGISEEMEGSGNRVTVYAMVDDLQATLNKVEQLGGKVVLPVTEVPGGPTIAMFSDPCGNITGIMKGM